MSLSVPELILDFCQGFIKWNLISNLRGEPELDVKRFWGFFLLWHLFLQKGGGGYV
jgi:hypothetical protein